MVAQKFHFAILRIEVIRASRGLSVIAELLVNSALTLAFSALTLLVRHLEEHSACKKMTDEVLAWLFVWIEVQVICI